MKKECEEPLYWCCGCSNEEFDCPYLGVEETCTHPDRKREV